MFKTDLQKIISQINGDTFFIGDTHFFHKNVMGFEPIREKQMKNDGFEDHEEWIIHNWNSVVGAEDLVVFMGDFAFKGINNLVGRLNGVKIFILGNHDRKGPNVYAGIFDYVLVGAYHMVGDKLYVAEANDKLFSTLHIEYEGKRLLLSHYPATEQEKRFYPVEGETLSESKALRNKIMADRINTVIDLCHENEVHYNVHGHTHSKCVFDEEKPWEFINCSLESIGFKPMRLRDLLGF